MGLHADKKLDRISVQGVPSFMIYFDQTNHIQAIVGRSLINLGNNQDLSCIQFTYF